MFSVLGHFSTLSSHPLYLPAFPLWFGNQMVEPKQPGHFWNLQGCAGGFCNEYRGLMSIFCEAVTSLAWQEAPGLSPPGLNHNFWNV